MTRPGRRASAVFGAGQPAPTPAGVTLHGGGAASAPTTGTMGGRKTGRWYQQAGLAPARARARNEVMSWIVAGVVLVSRFR